MVTAISIVKDEADIAGRTVRQMLEQADRVIVADNGSTDGTRDLLADLEHEHRELTVLDDLDPAYYQSRKMTALAAEAADAGAAWVLPFDADEFWYSPHGRIADVLARHPDHCVATVVIYDHRCTPDDPPYLDPIRRMEWRTREPLPLHKVACRPVLPVTITQGNHGAHYPTQTPAEDLIVIRHFPVRSVEQMIRKARNGAAAYAATNLPEDAGAHWRGWGRLADEELADVFAEHYFPGDAAMLRDPVSGLL